MCKSTFPSLPFDPFRDFTSLAFRLLHTKRSVSLNLHQTIWAVYPVAIVIFLCRDAIPANRSRRPFTMSSPIAIRSRTNPIPTTALQANDATAALQPQPTSQHWITANTTARIKNTRYEPSVPRGPDFGRWMLKERATDGFSRDIFSTYGRNISRRSSSVVFSPLLSRVRQFPSHIWLFFHPSH
jgi:hypothetical protein